MSALTFETDFDPGSPERGPLARARFCQFATSAEPRGVRYMGCPSDSAAPLSTPLAPYMLSLAPITSLSAYPALALSRHAGAPSYKILLLSLDWHLRGAILLWDPRARRRPGDPRARRRPTTASRQARWRPTTACCSVPLSPRHR